MTIVTHNGKFHADDVFAVATLLLFLSDKKVEIVRTRDEGKIGEADYVVDVGGVYDPEKRRFDHHQIGGAGKRENGIPYASFGLVWKEFGESLSNSAYIFEKIDESLVQTIDAIDNGIEPYKALFGQIAIFDVGDVIDAYVPRQAELSAYTFDEAFDSAVKIAREILKKEVVRHRETQKGLQLAKAAYEEAKDKRIIELTRPHSWKEELIQHPEPLFVIFPMEAGDRWAVKGVPKELHLFERRLLLPENWRGKRDEELQTETGVSDALFIHKDGFIGGARSKEGALELAKKALEHNNL